MIPALAGAATDDAAPLHLSITLKLIAFFSIK